MKTVIIFSVILITITDNLTNAVNLECYQCENALQPCEDNNANKVKCGDSTTSKCSRQVAKGSPSSTRAIRKCVIPDKTGHVYCPPENTCYECNTNLCNGNPAIVTTTTPKTKNSAGVTKYVWSSLVAVIFVAVYL